MVLDVFGALLDLAHYARAGERKFRFNAIRVRDMPRLLARVDVSSEVWRYGGAAALLSGYRAELVDLLAFALDAERDWLTAQPDEILARLLQSVRDANPPLFDESYKVGRQDVPNPPAWDFRALVDLQVRCGHDAEQIQGWSFAKLVALAHPACPPNGASYIAPQMRA